MPEYLAPGVYVEETSFRPKTIEGVSTSTAGFVGPARTGPTSGEPRLLTSFADFQRIYGGLEDLEFENRSDPKTNYLAYAVRAFFEEGGQRCYVARVFGGDEDEGRASGAKGGLTVKARYPGERGDMRVIFRPVPSRNVNRGQTGSNNDSDTQTRLPGLSMGDTVFAEPGNETEFDKNGAGVNFYDYVLDDDGDAALKFKKELPSGETPFKVKKLESGDAVFPFRIRAIVQQAIQRPGGGIEFGPEEQLGEYDLRPGSGSALVDALSRENPAGDPTMTPIWVGALKDDQGGNVQTGARYAREIFSNPMTGTKLFPVEVKGLENVKSYQFDVSFDPTEVRLQGVKATVDTRTPKEHDVVFNRSGMDVSKDPVQGDPLPQGEELLGIKITRRQGVSESVEVTLKNFSLLKENGDEDDSVSLDQTTITIAQGDDTAAIELDRAINQPGDDPKFFGFKFDLSLDGSKIKDLTFTKPSSGSEAEDLQVTPTRYFIKAEGLSPITTEKENEPELLLYLQGEVLDAVSESLGIQEFTTDNAGDAHIDLRLSPEELSEQTIRLKGGSDGQEPIVYESSGAGSGPPENPVGFDALEDLENVSIVAAPGYTAIGGESEEEKETNRLAVQNQLITHCQEMKYRIAVLDTPKGSTVKGARDWRGNIDSTYAAMYHPWITIFDPLTRSELNVPPSGHVAGLYARNDIEDGVHKAPANMVVRSAVGFETRINKAQQDVLNPEGVNCFRFFEGRGNRLWGARMATSDNEYKYVNIRRYLAYLERSIDEGTQVFVFENNGTDLWRNVRRTIGSFLKNEWRSDRLMGTTPEQAYFVKCDRSTMTQNDIDNGRLICEIGVALFRPAEFVIFRIGQKLLSDTG